MGIHLDPAVKPAECSCLVPRVIVQLWLYYLSYEQMRRKCNRRVAELAGGEATGVESARMWSDVMRDKDGNDETRA